MSKLRLFTAIDIGALQPLIELERELGDTDANLKLVEPDNIHVTLKFLGDTDEAKIPVIEEVMHGVAETIEPYTATVRGMGVFPHLDYIKVIWIGLDDQGQTTRIAKELDSQLATHGFKKEKHDFTPHATIARMKGARGKDAVRHVVQCHDATECGDIDVTSIQLKKSELRPEGPVYTTLCDVSL